MVRGEIQAGDLRSKSSAGEDTSAIEVWRPARSSNHNLANGCCGDGAIILEDPIPNFTCNNPGIITLGQTCTLTSTI